MEKKLKELKENLYDTIISGKYMEMNIGDFEVIAVNMVQVKFQPLLRVVVYKGGNIFSNSKIIFHKEYDINNKIIKTGSFSKPKLCEFDIQVIDTIMEDLTPIVAISELREQKLKKLGI